MQVPELIERAAKVTGSDYALAKTLGVTRQNVSGWKHAARACPADVRARMAELAGLDPMEALVEAIAEGLSEERRAGLMETIQRAAEKVRKLEFSHMVGRYLLQTLRAATGRYGPGSPRAQAAAR